MMQEKKSETKSNGSNTMDGASKTHSLFSTQMAQSESQETDTNSQDKKCLNSRNGQKM